MLRTARGLLLAAFLVAAPHPAWGQGAGDRFGAIVGGLVHSDLGSFINTGALWWHTGRV